MLSSVLRRTSGLGLPLILALAGCSAQHHRQDADKEVYDILRYKRDAALGARGPFTIDQEAWDALAGLPRRYQPLVPEAETEQARKAPAPALLSLAKSMEIAIRNSRDYQQRKEGVFLSALALTLDRDRYKPTFAGALAGGYQRNAADELWAGDTRFGVSQVLSTGGEATLTLTNDFLRYTTGAPRAEATSALAFSFVQPLWRGMGRKIEQETLTQSERAVVYDLRSFARYHKTFAVSIVSTYYRILLQRQVVRNEWSNYQRLILSREQLEMLAEAGRKPELEVDQARQNELSARVRYVQSRENYKARLDNLKIALSLPTDANVDVDEKELERLVNSDILHPDISAESAVRQALALRLDLLNAKDEVADARRKVTVAIDGLGPDVDLEIDAAVASQGDTRPARFRFDQGTYSAGLDIDLPFERTAERNTYRRTLINLARSERNVAQLADEIKQQVQQAWRNLQEARESYEIQSRSLALAKRRVDSTTLLQQAGRASTRDVLESNDSLLSAQNALTEELVNHTIARLELWRDIGTVFVDDAGYVKGPTK